MRKGVPISGILLAGFFLFGGFQTPTVTPLVKQEVEKLVGEYRRDQWRLCNKRALDHASVEVDSLIIIWAKANRDTLDRPQKPVKPGEPPRLNPKDSTPVAPLFQKDSLKK